MEDYYKILGIDIDSTEEDIKRAYRRLALKYHPDKNKSEGAAEEFIKATEAYEILIDSVKREEYDKFYQKSKAPSDFKAKQQKWHDYSRKKANEYSSATYNDFARKVFREARIKISYIPNLIAIFLVSSPLVVFLIQLPTVFSLEFSFLSLFTTIPLILILFVFDHMLIKTLIKDYSFDHNG